MSNYILLFFAFFVFFITIDTTSNNRNKRQENQGNVLSENDVLSAILKENIHKNIPQSDTSQTESGGPVVVTVNMYLRMISKINELDMDYSTQITFREEWVDSRLAYQNLGQNVPNFVKLQPGQEIWMPDTFFQNEKEARKHYIDKPNMLIRIYPDGRVLYSVRLSMVYSCPMSLEYFPFDKQTCLIDIASYAYTTEDIIYKFKEDNPIQQKAGLERSIPSFKLTGVSVSNCTSRTATGEYSCLRASILLKREHGFYLMQLYIPSIMLVVISWISFWIDKDAVAARVLLGVIPVLTLSTLAAGINAKLPQLSYTKAIDVWVGMCMMFIFASLIVSALVNYIGQGEVEAEWKRAKKRYENVAPGYEYRHTEYGPEGRVIGPTAPLVEGDVGRPIRSVPHGSVTKYSFVKAEKSKKIDIVSRILFPVCFILFNLIYWLVYLI